MAQVSSVRHLRASDATRGGHDRGDRLTIRRHATGIENGCELRALGHDLRPFFRVAFVSAHTSRLPYRGQGISV
jgi:hypothetical protein